MANQVQLLPILGVPTAVQANAQGLLNPAQGAPQGLNGQQSYQNLQGNNGIAAANTANHRRNMLPQGTAATIPENGKWGLL
jgi:hypothetical protein